VARALGLTRIAIVEDHLLFAESLELALAREGHDVHRVAIGERATPVGGLLAAILRVRPRVVLLDLDLGAMGSGARLVEPLARAGIAVVVLSGGLDRPRWGECLRHGARTVLPKSTSLNTVLSTIRLIGDGRPVIGREEREGLLSSFHEEKHEHQQLRSRLDLLTAREREILGHLMLGRPAREIARRSFVSEATVRTQVKSILAKLGVPSQVAAVGVAHRARWLPPVLREDA
jgi:DNA-binding NarL/FixJ family response regulator